MMPELSRYSSRGFWSLAENDGGVVDHNPYDLPVWERPSDYGGFSPEGDFVVVAQTRDSGALERSNYGRIFEDLREYAERFGEAPERDDIESGEEDWVYDYRANHWAVGWIEVLLVRQDAPEEIQARVREILDALSDYPVYDEEHWSQLEWEEREEDEDDDVDAEDTERKPPGIEWYEDED